MTVRITNNPLCMAQFDFELTLISISNNWYDKLNKGLAAVDITHLVQPEDVERVKNHLIAVAEDSATDPFIAVNLKGCGDSARVFAWLDALQQDKVINLLSMTSEQIDSAHVIRRLKNQNELILKAAGEGIYGLDANGKATFANEASTRILGWDHKEIIGEKLHAHHHHSHADGSNYAQEDCKIYAAIADGTEHRVEDEVFWHKDGHPVPVEYISSPIIEAGKIEGAVVLFRDISERLTFEQQRESDFREIKKLKEELEQERDYLRDEINIQKNFGEIVGSSLSLQRTLQQIEAVANTPSSVLVLGESGVGKEMFARAIHNHSPRKNGPMVKVNCASIPQDLFESEFFGHVKGSFTGAHRDRVGRLQLANGGTLFLDEVGEIPLDLQGKLLRALQEQEFERVGDESTIKVDVRIVAATNKDLLAEAEAGRFREDLYYRLSVFPITVPPLRERQADIGVLARHFLTLTCNDFGRDPVVITKSQVKALEKYNWPGNIRELKNVIERAVIMSTDRKLRLDLAMPSLMGAEIIERNTDECTDSNIGSVDDQVLTEAQMIAFQRGNIERAMKACNNKIAGKNGAAARLGLKPSTLTYRMQQLGLK
ncbi:Formate hydrogenlyase transcriptional activator FhlA [BD1-7 clade bacterium]|uniref:Formate hydrogenlyase transcriptional activator FhlA n=1 Tax=BD1-7 clade bacterium TaxID=2029982 RepID=A0A5S9QQ02_9GAMM|nr:Formate hydrogenlyase transcriptional activator FhlA [BD1-7 clade bacterium]